MSDLTELLIEWHKATDELKPGVQHVFKETFDLVSEGKVTNLTYGADYSAKGACLVNSVGTMLTVGGGKGVPMANFSAVVSLFDRINTELFNLDVNTTPGIVSPMAAEIFLHHFAPLKEMVKEETNHGYAGDWKYVEPSDGEMARQLASMFEKPAPVEISITDDEMMDLSVTPVDDDVSR